METQGYPRDSWQGLCNAVDTQPGKPYEYRGNRVIVHNVWYYGASYEIRYTTETDPANMKLYTAPEDESHPFVPLENKGCASTR